MKKPPQIKIINYTVQNNGLPYYIGRP